MITPKSSTDLRSLWLCSFWDVGSRKHEWSCEIIRQKMDWTTWFFFTWINLMLQCSH